MKKGKVWMDTSFDIGVEIIPPLAGVVHKAVDLSTEVPKKQFHEYMVHVHRERIKLYLRATPWYRKNFMEPMDLKKILRKPKWRIYHNEIILQRASWDYTMQCMMCKKEYIDVKGVQYCCDGMECGCMGQPIDPMICSDRCWDAFNERKKKGIVFEFEIDGTKAQAKSYVSAATLIACADDIFFSGNKKSEEE